VHGIDVRDLEAFLGVVDHGGFRAAAEALFISQPALSRRIRNLEAALGVTLLDRGAAGTRLTGHGRILLEGARQVDVTLRSAIERTRGAGAERIVFGATLGAMGYVAPYLSEWAQRHPNTRVDVIADGVVSLRSLLRGNGCDVAIISGTVGQDLTPLPFGHVEVIAIVPREHPLGRSEEDLPLDLLHGERVMLNGALYLSSLLFRTACTLQGVDVDIIYESASGQVLAAHAESGLGIAVCGDRTDLRGFDLPRRRIVDSAGQPLRFELSVCWNPQRPLSDHALAFARGLAAFEPRFSARRA
jgi:DNA-binding transcriptional LysR family regulator